MPKLAVLGQPISHSRSPAMHTAALAELGLAGEWSYEAIELGPEEFATRVRAMGAEGFRGANVTLPHKLAALAVAGAASEAAREIGAANTLTFTDEGEIVAENTDASGLIAAIGRPLTGATALVMGAGGSARACVWALRRAGAEVAVWNRTAPRGAELAAELGAREARAAAGELAIAGFEVIVNATTVGLAAANPGAGGAPAGHADLKALPFTADAIREEHVVVDLVYGSVPTPLASAARRRGAALVDGLEILVRQGADSLRSWTGMDPPLEVMRAAASGAR